MKKTLFRAVFFILISCFIAINGFSVFTTDTAKAVSSLSEISALSKHTAPDVKDIEQQINDLIEQRKAEAEEQRLAQERLESYDNLQKQLDEGIVTFRQLFSDTVIVGDSLMHGLSLYRIIDSSNIISMVSASLYHLQDNIGNIIADNPEKLVLHYGINMLNCNEHGLNSFISMYEDIIITLKSELPDTEIYISGIFNVSASVAQRFSWISQYNERLIQMSSELGICYIDNSGLLPGDGSYYGTDGIHVTKAFYNDVWLPHLFLSINSRQEIL